MSGIARDAVHALRLLTYHRGFAAAALTTIALAVGGTAAVFAVVYGVLFRPLPYEDARRLVRLWEVHPGAREPIPGAKVSGPTYRAWSSAAKTVQDVAAFGGRDYTLTVASRTQRVRGTRVTPSLFRVLRIPPGVGRLFDDADTQAGAPPVVVLSDGFWRDRFGGDAAAIGQTLVIDGLVHEIVGVTPSGFAFPEPAVGLRDDRQEIRLYTPLTVEPTPGATVIDYTEAIARLKPGVTTAQAEAEGTAYARAVERPMADLVFGTGNPVEVRVRSLADQMTMSVRPALEMVAANVTLVLLVASANLASLFLSRGSDRVREMGIRSALGASRRRLIRQLAIEGLVISLIGGLVGLLIGWGLTSVVVRMAPADFPRLDQVRVDGWFVVAAAIVAVIVGTLSTVVPAVRGSRADLATAMQGSGRVAGAPGRSLRRVLLAGEAAFAVVLLVGAALLARSFVTLVGVDAGYDPSGVVTGEIRLPGDQTHADASRAALAIIERLRAMPGVRAAGAGDMAPFGSMLSRFAFRLPGATDPDGRPVVATALRAVVTAGYAEALGMRLKEGRLLRPEDATSGNRPILVNESFKKTYFTDGRAATGRRFAGLFPRWLGDETVVEVVGVVDDMLPADLDGRRQPQIFVSLGGKAHIGHITVVVRTSGDPAAIAPLVRSAARQVASGATIERIGPLASKISDSVAAPRFTTAVLTSFALLALALAATGLYGGLSYDVAQRRREIGVRMALGAPRHAVVRLVLREGLMASVSGLAAGVFLALLLTRQMTSLLFGVTPLDVASFVAAPLVLFVVAVVSCLIPACRAAADNPVDALRTE